MKRLWILVLLATSVIAQNTGEISGIVRGPARAPLSGVRIRIVDQSSREETIVYTDNNGEYRAVSLAPHYFTIEPSRAGFKTDTRRDLDLRSTPSFHLDLELSPESPGWSLPPQGTWMYAIILALIGLITVPGQALPGNPFLSLRHELQAPGAGDREIYDDFWGVRWRRARRRGFLSNQ